MPKSKRAVKKTTLIQSLEELISDYDRPTMAKALANLKSELGWKVLRAALMKEYLVHVPLVLDQASKSGRASEAAYEAGVSQTLFDVANSTIDAYTTILENASSVVQAVRPEE